MSYNHWFISRQKRKLTSILDALIAFSDICVGKPWSGNKDLQLMLEDTLGERNITEHGSLRARRSNEGGGGIRTLFTQMKDLGLVFCEDSNNKCRLTLVAESMIKGDISFVKAMTLQLQRYQYPSATRYSGSGSVSQEFKVHPFQFMFRLMRDARLENYISMDEMYGIVIHYAKSDSDDVYEEVVSRILKFRNGEECGFVNDDRNKTLCNIANTFFNYISLTQLVERLNSTISIRQGKEKEVDAFINGNKDFIPNSHLSENYTRKFGRGLASKDLRNFDREGAPSQKELREARIRNEFVLLSMKTPITEITSRVIESISSKTGFDSREVEIFLRANFTAGNVDDFFLAYKELAHLGREGSRSFELATVEIFRILFHMRAEHTGDLPNAPDVFVESTEQCFCGIIDNKAYKTNYTISGDHKRRMTDEYIPNYKDYGKTDKPLVFFVYIANTFGRTINAGIKSIFESTNVKGSAIPVDTFINFAQDYIELDYGHRQIKELFSKNREICTNDIEEIRPEVDEDIGMVAEPQGGYNA